MNPSSDELLLGYKREKIHLVRKSFVPCYITTVISVNILEILVYFKYINSQCF